MKRLILSFTLLSFFFVGCATVPPSQLKKEEFVTLEGMSKKQIYDKSLQWLASTFNSAKSVLEYKDENSGRIIGNIVTTKSKFMITYKFKSSMTIDIKDGRARLTFQPHSITIDKTTRSIYGDSEKDMAHDSLKSIKTSFVNYMNSGGNNSNW